MKIPHRELTKVFHQKIRDLAKLGYTYDEIAEMLRTSKTTISFVLKGRPKGKVTNKS